MPVPPDDDDDPLEAAWQAFEDGRPDEALELCAECPAGDPDAQALRIFAHVDLGDLPGARRVLERAHEATFELGLAEGALLLAEWRLADARAHYEALLERERDAGALERLSLVAELEGDFARAERLYAEACALDPEGFPPIERIAPKEFAKILDAAVRSLPAEFRAALDDTNVVVDAVPTRAHAGARDPSGTPPDMLGLFHGLSDLEGGAGDGFEVPPTIYLFQRNLERAALDRATLEREIAITLYHELAHKLGFDEHGVDDMGLA